MFHKFTKPVGIVGYGAYIPKLKLDVNEVLKAHGSQQKIEDHFKAVPAGDEDTVTFSLNVISQMQESFPMVKFDDIQAIYVGSESHPYAVKSTGTILSEYLNISDLTSANLEFACKAGTAAIQIVAAQVASGMIKQGLAIGADIAQSKPGDALEISTGAGAAGFILNNDPNKMIARLIATASVTTDTPDFWRRSTAHFPQHLSRFTGQPAYFKHVTHTIQKILGLTKLKPEDFKHVILHSPNLKFPNLIAKQFGFKRSSLIHQTLFPKIGNAYAGSTMLGLAYALQNAKANDLILVVSYGSGAGSDGMILKVTDQIQRHTPKLPLSKQFNQRKEIGYLTYLS